MNRLRRFMLNGILMAGVTLAMRFVAVALNVYVSNSIGAVAMGLFTLITTVYGFGITFATSGINLATTRLVAEAIGDTSSTKARSIPADRQRLARAILCKCILYALFFGGAATVILLMLAEVIGCDILKDSRTVVPMQLLAITFIPISVSSVLGGYFSAVRRVYKNAITQILGQGIKIFGCIAFLRIFGVQDTEAACIAVVCGILVSELASFALNVLLYLFEKRSGGNAQKPLGVLGRILSNALPLALSAYMRSALVTVEHILIPQGLQKSGSSKDLSLAAYGTVSSMAFPLVLFPSAISAAFAGLLIPEIAESCATGDERRIKGMISTVIETILIFSIGCAGVLTSFSLELGKAVYPQSDSAGLYILLIAPLIPVMYLDTGVDAMLKGMGEHVYSMIVNVIDALASVILVAILLPKMGILGYIVTVYFTEILNAALSITRLLLRSHVKTHVILWVGRPLLCIIAATQGVSLFCNHLFCLDNVWLHIGISAVVYVLLLIPMGGIKPRVIAKSLKYMIEKA